MVCLIKQITFLLLAIVTTTADTRSSRSNGEKEGENDMGGNISKILNAFFSSGYDKRVRPNYGGTPVEVGISMFLISISTVSEVKMDFTTDFYFRQAWNDPRLSFKPLPGINELYVGAEVADKIWVPDTFFANEKSAYFHIATTPNTFLRIGSNGAIFRSIRLTVTASCPMDLQYFPMDSQMCSIEIESYGYSMSDIKYKWGKGDKSVGLSDSLSLPQFRVVGHLQLEKVIPLSTGNYSRLIAKIQFARSLGFYLIQIYIPASLIVVISWVSFWLHRNATPARVSLGVTTVLTMTTLMSSTNSQLPKISYVKSIDVFLGTCFVMVFASLLEYATVGYLGKRISMRKQRAEQLAKAQEEQRKQLAALNAPPPPPPPPVPPPPPLNQGQVITTSLLPALDENTQAQQLLLAEPPNLLTDGHGDIPPPIPPAPMGLGMNPMMSSCPYTGSPRTLAQYAKYPPNMYHVSGGPPGYGPRPPALQLGPPPPGHYDRYGGLAHLPGCPPNVRTCTPTHIICTGHDGHTGGNLPLQSNQPGLQSQLQQSHGLKINTTPGSEGRKSIIKETSSSAHRKDPGGPPTTTGTATTTIQPTTGATTTPIHHPPPIVRPFPGKGFFGTTKSKPNPNKLLGVGPSDIDKYSRVIFPVCFICFNLMYWIIYTHISDNVVDDLVPHGGGS